MDLPRSKQARTLPEVLSRQEVNLLMDGVANLKHRVILRTLYSVGLRLGEVVSLRPSHIDSKRMVIRVELGKGRKDRYTILSETLLQELRVYYRAYRPEKYLFEGRIPGVPYSVRSVQSIMKDAVKRVGIERRVSVHTLRHSFATHLIEGGLDVVTLQHLLGHKDVSTTSKYIHITNNYDQVEDLLGG